MSETVHYVGTLKKVDRLVNETLEEQCKRLLSGMVLKSYYESYQEMLQDQFYKEYIVHDDNVYSVDMKDVDSCEDVFSSYEGVNGVINFEVMYYNGACGFNEAIEEALSKRQYNKGISLETLRKLVIRLDIEGDLSVCGSCKNNKLGRSCKYGENDRCNDSNLAYYVPDETKF